MISLIIGEPDSGKSALAEELALNGGYPRVCYLATMLVMDEAGERRRDKHRKMREGKGFFTLEIPYRVDRAVSQIEDPGACTVLLECLSNLVGNEMHEDPERKDLWKRDDGSAFTEAILSDLLALADSVAHLIIVTNEYRTDASYDGETQSYIRLLSMLNRALIPHAREVRDLRTGTEVRTGC